MTRSFYTDTVTRRRAPLADDGHGNEAPDWDGEIGTATITGCRVQPIDAEEVMANRFESHTTHRLLAPLGSDVTFLDEIVYSGVTYEVTGNPRSHRSPSGVAAHDEIGLKRVTG